MFFHFFTVGVFPNTHFIGWYFYGGYLPIQLSRSFLGTFPKVVLQYP